MLRAGRGSATPHPEPLTRALTLSLPLPLTPLALSLPLRLFPTPKSNPNPDQVLYAFYETYEDNLMEVGHSTPSVPAGQDTTLTEDPARLRHACLD